MKKVIALIFAFAFLVGCVHVPNGVIGSLGKYSDYEYHDCGGWQDVTVYAKYSFDEPAIENNKFFISVGDQKSEIVDFLEHYKKWIDIHDSESELVKSYDFNTDYIDANDYFYIDGDIEKTSSGNLYFYDVESKVLYWFHNNI
ncbi:MAG: hypothetical protein IJY88_02110 [Clostridia bacterium]|nr:hypothetical protein [Clostridia bacterium]